MIKEIIALDSEAGERLDRFLSQKKLGLSRSEIQKLLKKFITVNGKIAKPSYRIKAGDRVVIRLKEGLDSGIRPEKADLKIIYQDENLLIINKPNGLTVHPTNKNQEKTLVNRLLYFYPEISQATFDRSEISLLRPGIVHRLDKDTSGLIVIAKNKETLLYLSEQFKNRKVEKIYHTLVCGWPKESGELISNISRDPKKRTSMTEGLTGKLAISCFKTKDYYQTEDGDKLALLEVKIKTGRTHQIRLQLKKIGHPVLGDKTYNTKESRNLSQKLKIQRQMLHASKISFVASKNKLIAKYSKLPADFVELINQLNKSSIH